MYDTVFAVKVTISKKFISLAGRYCISNHETDGLLPDGYAEFQKSPKKYKIIVRYNGISL